MRAHIRNRIRISTLNARVLQDPRDTSQQHEDEAAMEPNAPRDEGASAAGLCKERPEQDLGGEQRPHAAGRGVQPPARAGR